MVRDGSKWFAKVGSRKSECRSQKSEVESRKSEVGSQKSEVGSPSSAFVVSHNGKIP